MTENNTDGLAMEIAKRVTALRLHKTWTRDTLAQKAGINVYTLKHFERTGQISLQRLIAISQALDAYDEMERLFKPRHRVDVQNWEVAYPTRKRGRRRTAQKETHSNSTTPPVSNKIDTTPADEDHSSDSTE